MKPADRTALLIGACEWGDLEALGRLLELGEGQSVLCCDVMCLVLPPFVAPSLLLLPSARLRSVERPCCWRW